MNISMPKQLEKIDLRDPLNRARKLTDKATQQPIHEKAVGAARDRISDLSSAVQYLRKAKGDLPIHHRTSMTPYIVGSLLAGVAIGAVAMYILDPQMGVRRRALIADKTGRYARQTGDLASGQAKDLRNRAEGATHGVTDRFEQVRGGAPNSGQAETNSSATTL